MDKTETIVQLKKLLASKKAADLLKALKKLQRNYFPEFGNTVVDIFEERYKRNISWEVQVEAIKIIGKQHLVKALPLLEQIVKNNMGKYKLFFLLMIFLCISCGNNKISIRVESALISSSDNQPLRSLTLENDSLLFTYQILLKDGYVGLSSINLNRINDAYVITYGNSIIENEKFHLQPDATYIISNYSIPDAKSHALEFKTNPRGNVKSVKEVK